MLPRPLKETLQFSEVLISALGLASYSTHATFNKINVMVAGFHASLPLAIFLHDLILCV